jgi:anaerobic ribonucleoside-triphosphate reductase activating protein
VRCRIHAFEPRSRSNGPGLRSVVWLQGCTLGCPGCFNPASHARSGGWEADTQEIVAEILRASRSDRGIEGVTFSGGEPLEQPEAVLEIVQGLETAGLGFLLFTGFTVRELVLRPLAIDVLCRLDAVIAGRYVAARRVGRALLGSTNQELLFISRRYTPADFSRVPIAEWILRDGGSVSGTGIGGSTPLAARLAASR